MREKAWICLEQNGWIVEINISAVLHNLSWDVCST
ncbi:hypothetical protein SLEP1_g50921 [Rubroshorea leprosula]|uniref:Uncharacterized protein n=1 Tax=Rubroshorea leprosula TaxID=152421 RepID=A0AAV5M4S5_9ROSI|nr:hypothetical protein SLEP1_g50921 [Rubroshorea leprosula]